MLEKILLLIASILLAAGQVSVIAEDSKENVIVYTNDELPIRVPETYDYEPKTLYALQDTYIYYSTSKTSGKVSKINIGTQVTVINEQDGLYQIDSGYIRPSAFTESYWDVFFTTYAHKYASENTPVYARDGSIVQTLSLNTELNLYEINSAGYYRYGDYYLLESDLMDEYYVEPMAVGPVTITKSGGIYYYGGRKETYYSSNVLYHYRTSEWTADAQGFYRTSDGYYVVAALDMSQGTVFQCSKGYCIVLDSGCAAGTTDYYVNW